MKKIRPICLLLGILMLLSSCSSVYVDPPEIPDDTVVYVDTNGEYFTDGSIEREGSKYDGFFYEGCWIYVESQPSRGVIGERHTGDPIYGEKNIDRIVKYNPKTGTVSSPCLDPVCNHSIGSGCLMLSPNATQFQKRIVFNIQKIVGDWMLIATSVSHEEYISQDELRAYNLKTGESFLIFEELFEGSSVTRYISNCVVGDKLYRVRYQLDYSDTEYIPGKSGESLVDYTPKTICTLVAYDFGERKLETLFDIPAYYRLAAISNRRFFFQDDKDIMYSCNLDGSNMRREDVLNFAPENLMGTYAYHFISDGFEVYDLKTNQIKSFTVDFNEPDIVVLSNRGMMFDYLTSYDDWLKFRDSTSEFLKEHADLGMDEKHKLLNEASDAIFYNGTGQIWMMDHDGGNLRKVFELENAFILTVYAVDNFVFAYVELGDPENNCQQIEEINQGRSMINIDTGEIIFIPYLDIVIPSEMAKPY